MDYTECRGSNLVWRTWLVLYLGLNLVTRLAALYNQGVLFGISILLTLVVMLLLWQCFARFALLCFILGCTLPLFGFQSYTVYGQVFEYLLVVMAMALLFHDQALPRPEGGARILLLLLVTFVLLAAGSELLLPLAALARQMRLWGLFAWGNYFFSATPENPLSGLAACNRLVLFFTVAVLFARRQQGRRWYRALFTGGGLGVLVATLLGLLSQHGILDLTWYRPEFKDASGVDRLQSVFGNPGWFAQYVIVAFPFIFLLPGQRWPSWTKIFFWMVCLVLCGVALVLTASRTSWLIFPLLALAILPVVLVSGQQEDRIRQLLLRRNFVISLIVIILLLGSFVGGFLLTRRPATATDWQNINVSRTQYLILRLKNIAIPEERLKVWKEGVSQGMESPWVGLGYGAYKWHQQIMLGIPQSRLSQHKKSQYTWDTPHNFFIQLFCDMGVVGIVLWGVLAATVVWLLWQDLQTRGHVLSLVLLASFVGFHLYGITQSMQYIPVIWFLGFLVIGYCLSLEVVSFSTATLFFRMTVLLMVPTLIVVLVAYARNFSSLQLARRYHLAHYSIDPHPEQFSGFYPPETKEEDGIFRWTGPRAEILPGASGLLQLVYSCTAPDLDTNPIVLDVFLNGFQLDRATFWNHHPLRRTYWIPPDAKDGRLLLKVSRTWVPRLVGLGQDTRRLGVAVGEPVVVGRRLDRDIGWSGWELARKIKVAGRTLGPVSYRWTRMQAHLSHPGTRTLLLRSGPQEPGGHPLGVRITSGVREINIMLTHNRWQYLVLPLDWPIAIHGLHFQISRTVNPRKQGYGDDPRDLGVAVALENNMYANTISIPEAP